MAFNSSLKVNRKERVVGGRRGGCEEKGSMVMGSKEASVAGVRWVAGEPLRQNQRGQSQIDHQRLVDEQKGCGLYAKYGRKHL